MSTSGEYHEYIGVIQYIGGYHEHIGDIMSTLGDVQYIGDIMMHVGEQGDNIFSIYIENHNVLNIFRCTHDITHMHHDIPQYTEHPPMYS